MSVAHLFPAAFTAGEVTPGLFGRFDTARLHVAAATARNGFISYRGGFYSRAGTEFVGFSKQTLRNFPPRLITFQFSINQGLALEFGNFYMRVIFDGGFVTESPFAITGITNTNPAVVSYRTLSTGVAATANNGVVSSSYQRGDTITLAGGVFSAPAVLVVNTSTLVSLAVNAGGSGYVIGDTLVLAGGTPAQMPVITVTGVSGGAITSFAISSGGAFNANGSGAFTQYSTSGAGTGATFKTALFGPLALTFQNVGSYTTVPTNPVNQAATSGVGAGATFNLIWATPAGLASGDWVALAGVNGMTQVNGQTYVISALTGTATSGTFTLSDVYGHPIDATGFGAYTNGGTAARIYTLVTPWAEQDLRYLKFTQSADVMSLCCVNQQSQTEYQPQDLTRLADDNWVLSGVVAEPTVAPPTSPTGSASSSGTTDYAYVITSVNDSDGTESIASAQAVVTSAVNIASTAGTITVTWTPVQGVNEYNIYKATPGDGVTPPAGSLFGYAGSAFGTQFLDSNIVADFTQVPPSHLNPFARGQITGVKITNGGSGSSFTATINSVTGSGAVLTTVVVSNVLVAVIVADPGQNYQPGDTITFNNSATGTLVLGAQSGTFPAVVAYFQERRFYGYTLNNPDTYFGSQPGSFTNFDARTPTIDSDAITGTPWAVEVNGIQFMLPMPGGLLVMTGLGSWLLNGGGGALSAQPFTPANQDATPQTFNGCSQTVAPFKVDNDVVYLQAKGSIYRRFNYQIYANIYTGEDITINSGHMFQDYTILEHAWCEEPFKTLWAVRSDGVLLTATINKPQEVLAWTRGDTDGLYQSVCSVTEPPVDALYLATQRFPGGNSAYMIERMNDRLWSSVDNVWCVDCGLALAQPMPNATLAVSSATGLGACTGATGIVAGAGYSGAAFGVVVDAPTTPGAMPGPGAGAVPTLTFVGGALTAVSFAPGSQGTGYVNPKLVISDPAGSAGGAGATAAVTLSNAATATASASVFSNANVGNVIRAGGGIMTVTGFTDTQHVAVNITQPVVQVRQRTDGTKVPLPLAAGAWSMTAPVSVVTGGQYLAGMLCTGLADGVVIPAFAMPASGTVALSQPSTSVVIGLGFTAQLQSVYLDGGETTIQGQRKKIAAVTARVEGSRGLQIGTNQIDGSTLSPPQTAVTWGQGQGGMTAVPDKGIPAYVNPSLVPLYTGDVRIPTAGGYATPGQVAMQQVNPLPMQISALIPEELPGDVPQLKAQPKQQARAAA